MGVRFLTYLVVGRLGSLALPCERPPHLRLRTSAVVARLPHLQHFNDIITFFSLDDIKSLTSTFKNQLIFNGVFAIWAEYSKLTFEFNQFHQMDAPELDSYINNLTQQLLTRYNSLNHHSFLSMPYIHQDIAFRSHIKGNLDPTKSALQARFYQLKPFLNFNSSNITDTIRQAY